MKWKDRLFHTDWILLAGLFMGFIKTANSLSVILSIPEWLDSILTLGMCGCYGLHVLLQQPGLKRLAAYGAAALIGMYSALRSGDMSGLITLLTCIALAGCDFDRIMKKLFWWNLVFFLVNAGYSVILALINEPIGSLIYLHYDITPLVHLGYGHKNIMAMHMVSIVFLWIWGNLHTIRPRHLLLLLAAATLFLPLNQCKTAYLVILWICLMLFWFLRAKKDPSPLLKTAAAWAPAGLFAFSVVCMCLYQLESPVAILLSNLMTHRIALCAMAWEQYGLTFFGHLASEVAQVENRIIYMDNAFLYGMVQVGAIWPIAFCIAFFLLARRTNDLRVHLGILLWGLYAMTELIALNGLMFVPALLPALLLAPDSVFSQKQP